jgi:acetyl-CoA C-acetyltransferase
MPDPTRPPESPLERRLRRLRRQVAPARELAKLIVEDPATLLVAGRELLVSRGILPPVPSPQAGDPDRTPPLELAAFDRSVSAVAETGLEPAAALAAAIDFPRWPDWFSLHANWPAGEPEPGPEPGASFREQIRIMGIPVEVIWTVAGVEATKVRLDGVSRAGVSLSMFGEAVPAAGGGSRIHLDIGLSGDPVRGPLGASVQRTAQDALATSADQLSATLDSSGTRVGPIIHTRTGLELAPTTPVIVGVGQVVERHPDGRGPDPAGLCAQALVRAASDAGAATDLLAAADAVYAVQSVSWSYRDQAAAVAEAVGATPTQTVVSAGVGGDAGQLVVNAAAQAIANGEAEIVLVCGGEAGATLAAAQKRGETPDWPTQAADVTPSRVLAADREGSNSAETTVGLTAPTHTYALIESALAAGREAAPAEHLAAICDLWSRFSQVGAENPYAWLPEAHTADELGRVSDQNRVVASPYRKLLCANLQVDLSSGLILTSVAAAQAAGIPQAQWVFPHAGAGAYDEWFVSERADLTASPAIATLGRAVLAHAGIGIDDVSQVDLYSCFPAAVEIAATALGLPWQDPERPLTVTGGLTWAGGPGNNYGGHGIATIVGRLREDPDAYGLTTSLGWYLTKHAIGIYSATPPRRPYADLHPVVEHPPSRRALTDYTGPAVLEAFTVPHGRDGAPEAAIITALTPDGDRALVRSTQPEVIEALLHTDAARRPITVLGDGEVAFAGPEREALPAPPPSPVLVRREGPVTVITLNRPELCNAIDRKTALLLERAIDNFEADPDARVAVLTGAGEAFCAGMDLKAAARGEYPLSDHRGPLGLAGQPPSKPLIAAVEGSALAGGCELALSADLIVAAETASFGIPEAKRGLVAAGGGVLRLAERLPRAVVLELALTGEPMPATRMAELGLVNTVTAPGETLAVALALAAQIAANAPLSIELSKRIVDEHADWPTAERFDRQIELSAPALASEDSREGIRAFNERRAPVWSGR